MRCCYSCKHWERAVVKKAMFDVKRTKSDEVIVIEVLGRRVEVPAWNYEIDEAVKELVEGIRRGSVGYCYGRIIRPWDAYECFEPRFVFEDYDEEEDEYVEEAYLACWTAEGCPFKEECYKKRNYPYFG